MQCLTDDKYKSNMVCVLAGYASDIDQLMEANPGLASRFPETLHFPDFSLNDCCRLLTDGLLALSTSLTPKAASLLPEVLSPIVQVRKACSRTVATVGVEWLCVGCRMITSARVLSMTLQFFPLDVQVHRCEIFSAVSFRVD